MFRGSYHGKQSHENDFEHVIKRAVDAGCVKFMVTGSDLKESKQAIQIAEKYPGRCYATVGVHPCSANQFAKFSGGTPAMIAALKELALHAKETGHAVAFGEIGLDYDRLFLTQKSEQLEAFEAQLDLAVELQLPLFLHSRACADDFEALLKRRLDQLPKRGLVHSFTGSLEEMQRLLDMGFHIGVNGCSLKTEENVAVVKEIPLDKLQIETDGPWCEMRASHASAQYLKDAPPVPKAVKKERWTKDTMIKGRNEPCTIVHVAWAVAKIKGITVEELCDAAWKNTITMFGLGETVE